MGLSVLERQRTHTQVHRETGHQAQAGSARQTDSEGGARQAAQLGVMVPCSPGMGAKEGVNQTQCPVSISANAAGSDAMLLIACFRGASSRSTYSSDFSSP